MRDNPETDSFHKCRPLHTFTPANLTSCLLLADKGRRLIDRHFRTSPLERDRFGGGFVRQQYSDSASPFDRKSGQQSHSLASELLGLSCGFKLWVGAGLERCPGP